MDKKGKYLVEFVELQLSKFSYLYKDFAASKDDNEKRELVLDYIKNVEHNTEYNFEYFDSIEEARKARLGLVYGIKNDYLNIEYQVIWIDDDIKEELIFVENVF